MAGVKFKWISGLKRIFVKYPEELKEEVPLSPLDLEKDSELEQLKQKIDFLEKKLFKYTEITKQLTEAILEVTEDYQVSSGDQSNDIISSSKTDSAGLQLVEQKLQELRKKYDAILDILADKFAENETLPNLFVGDVSLRELWRKNPNHKDVLLYSIAYMMKKEFEEKGVKIR
jgi:hypothetical protein